MKNKLALIFLNYLRLLARLQLQKNRNAKIIGITGSAGKSSTRNALHAVLKNKYKVKVSFGANSESGIPLDILGLQVHDYSFLDWLRLAFLAPIKLLSNFEKFDFYIVEMGIDSPDKPKNMEFLLSIVQPQVGIMLNVDLAHSLTFDRLVKEEDEKKRQEKILNLIAEEKGKLLKQLKSNQLAIVNLDDIRVKAIAQKLSCQMVSFGQAKTNDLYLKNTQYVLDKTNSLSCFTFQISNFSYVRNRNLKNKELKLCFTGQILPKEIASSLAMAVLFALQTGLKPSEIKESLEKNFRLPPGRASLLTAINNSQIYDSSYNASSMLNTFALIKELSPQIKGRRLALLGDIRELGTETASVHRQVAKAAGELFDLIFLVGPAMEKYALPVLEKKAQGEVVLCKNALEAGQMLKASLEKDDLLLVKGSQNQLYLEEAVKQLLADKKTAKDLLCRQSAWWLEVKEEFFRQQRSTK